MKKIGDTGFTVVLFHLEGDDYDYVLLKDKILFKKRTSKNLHIQSIDQLWDRACMLHALDVQEQTI